VNNISTTLVALSTLSTGLVILFISLPLIYRKIPMNHLYGIRIPAAFESEQHWYDINAYGGRKLAAWSWLITAAGVVGFFVPLKYALIYVLGSTAVTLLAIGIPIIQILRWSRRHDV
jgi:SdpI/YfhL protein family